MTYKKKHKKKMVCLSGFQRNKISPLNENCLTTEKKTTNKQTCFHIN